MISTIWIVTSMGGSVPSKPKKTGTFCTFFGRQPTKILKIGTCKFGRNFLHKRNFHKAQFRYFFKDEQNIFWRFKPFTGHSMDIQQWATKKTSDIVGKLSACKFIKTFWAHFPDLCVQKKAVSCEIQTHFRSVPAARFTEKVLGAISRFVCRANRHSWLQHFVKVLWARFTILRAHKFLLCCWDTLWSSWLSHFVRMLWIWTHLGCECTHKLWLYAKHFQTSLGLAPQTCFVISELRKSEQILWILT